MTASQDISAQSRRGAGLRTWYRASRPFTLTASVVPVLVGSALAYQEGQASLTLFALMLVASVLVQVGANLVDEYSDHLRPEGSQKVPAPYKVIALGLLQPQAVKRGAITCFGVATIIGVYLVAVAGWPIFALSLVSLLVAYFYAGGPKPLGTFAIGQPLVFIFMGLGIVTGAYYVHTHTVTVEALVLSAAVGCMVTAILVANDLRDLEEDRAAGKRTPVTLLGRPFGRWSWAALVMAGFFIVVWLATAGAMGLTTLLALLALPQAIRALRTVWSGDDRPRLLMALRQSAKLHLWFGTLLALGVGMGGFA
ncbi:MAG: 1,4-dihydroxy-2-naphthoate octaprenyltransferase [Chloroflexi bacterium]|nr:1,4-dihydroxy-2-naphthoate octaprenyltransferase [Chloroflexota bacterium]